MTHTNFTYKAFLFAKKAHEGVKQTRKYTGEDYIVHPVAVAELVASVRPTDENLIAAAFLHDTVEDTHVTLEQILAEFGEDVANLVSEVTDVSKPSDGNRKARKYIDFLHIARASKRAKILKLADLIDNTKTISKHDPEFARTYIEEKERLLTVLNEANDVLFERALDSIKEYYKNKPE